MSNNTGKVSQIIGPVVDVVFDNNENELPNIYDSLEITRSNGSKLVLECQQHIGEDTVRAIAMETTDGISRGVDVLATGAPIMMPAGEKIKGRVFNVIGGERASFRELVCGCIEADFCTAFFSINFFEIYTIFILILSEVASCNYAGSLF